MSLTVVDPALQGLAKRRPVFHGEADFQHALAWQLQLDHPDASIRLETRPLAGKSVFLDLLLRLNGVETAFELKYLVRDLTTTVDAEHFQLREQSAHDVRRYDIVKEIARLEAIIGAGAAHGGVMIALTNDPAYWTAGRGGTVDAAFRLHDGVILTGTVGWAAHAGTGTMAKRTEALTLRGSYELRWRDYSDTGDRTGRFRVLVVPVTDGAPHAPSVGTPTATISADTSPSDEGNPRSTRRQEVLDAIQSLERRHGREAFSPAALEAEVLVRGSGHSKSTIRTHITSVMCVNAPPNHMVRYPDLERVGRGLYRRAGT